MRLTVIPSDNIIIKDGQRLVFEFAAPADLHAIQWYGTHGFVETTDGKQVRTDDQADVQAYIDAHAAEVARLAAIAATPKTLEQVRTEKLAALDADRRRIETLPIAGNQGGKTFSISRPEKINEFLMGGLSVALDPSPQASFTMLDDNGVEVTYTKVLMGQIISFINSSKQPALKRYDARKKAIEDAQDAADLARIDTDLTKP